MARWTTHTPFVVPPSGGSSLHPNLLPPKLAKARTTNPAFVVPPSGGFFTLFTALLLLSPTAWADSNSDPHGEITTQDGRHRAGVIQLADGLFHVTDTNGQHTAIPTDDLVSFRLIDPPAAPATAAQTHGLRATYFSEPDFKGNAKQQIDDVVDFNWAGGEPIEPLGPDRFTVRWEGQVEPPVSGYYNFHTISDDGVRLWVNERMVIDRWVDQAASEARGEIELQEGQRVPIKLEYYESAGEAVVRLFWTVPGPSPTRDIIPRENLYPGALGVPALSLALSGADSPHGLLGLYYNNTGLQGDVIAITNRAMDLNWDQEAPLPGVNADQFSVRWTGLLTPPESGDYSFHAEVDDGMRLWIDNVRVMDQWKTGVFETSSEPVALKAGHAYPIRLEMFENRGGAKMRLFWSRPDHPRELIPSTAFTPDARPGESGAVSALTHGVSLRNGSFLVRRVRNLDDSDLTLTGDPSPAPLPLFQVARIYFRPMPDEQDARLQSGRPGALLRNGDFVDGACRGVNRGRVLLNSVALGLQRVPLDQVAVLVLSDPAPSHTLYEIVLRDGSRLRVKALRPDAGQVHLSESGFGGWSIPLQDLAAIRRSP